MKNYSMQEAEHVAMIMVEAGFTAHTERTIDAIKRMYNPNSVSMTLINNTMMNVANGIGYINFRLA